jgi:thymidylate kinase
MKDIMLSGPDGVGKSTITNAVKQSYIKESFTVRVVWLRFFHYFSKVVNFVGRLFGYSFYESYEWGRVGYHNYTGLIGYFYILSVYVDLILFQWLFSAKKMDKKESEVLIVDRYILDVMADLIVDTGKKNLVLKLFRKKAVQEMKRFKTFILYCDYELVIRRRSDIMQDKSYFKKMNAYDFLADELGVCVINTGELGVDDIVEFIKKY